MDTNEKLDLFRDMVFQNTEESVAAQIRTFEESLEKVLNDHQREKTSKNKIIIETEKEDVNKERNKQIAQLQLQMQRDLHKEQQKLKEEIFEQVHHQLTAFMQTEAYLELLEQKIKRALSIAGSEDIKIYVDPVDANKVAELEKRTGHTVAVSDRSFLGGIRGVISSRNMLIDYSFLKKMEAERENFSFDFVEEEDAL